MVVCTKSPVLVWDLALTPRGTFAAPARGWNPGPTEAHLFGAVKKMKGKKQVLHLLVHDIK